MSANRSSLADPYAIYTNCLANSSFDHKTQDGQVERLNWIYKTFHGWLGLPLALLGLCLTIIYIFAVCRAIRQRKVSRKCYLLLLNHAIGDTMACLIALGIVGYVLCVTEVNRNVTQLIDVLFIGSFWCSMVSFVSLSVLKAYAVAWPLSFVREVTMTRCIYIIVFSWMVFLLMVFCASSVTALVKIQALREWSGCRTETCLRHMYRAQNLLTTIIYFFTLACFIVTVIMIRRVRYSSNSFHHRSTHQTPPNPSRVPKRLLDKFPLWKLALNVFTFAFFNVFYVIFAIRLLINTDKCFFQKHYATMQIFLGLVRASLLVRIVVDPLLAFLTDIQIQRIVLNMFNLGFVKPFGYGSRRVECILPANSEENSSELEEITKTKTSTSINTIMGTSKDIKQTSIPSQTSADLRI